MTFCENCGKQLEIGQKFCDGCGTAVGGSNQTQHYTPPAPAPVSVNTTTIIAKTFRCSSCGNSLEIPKNPRGTVCCPYCKNECILDGIIKNAEMAAKENINSGVPLTASPAKLHQIVVSTFYEAPNLPLDFFDKAEVIREEHYCIPAYCFYCNGTVSFTYEVGVEKQTTYNRDRGDYSEDVTKYHTEWQPQSSSASVTAILFSSGNKELSEQIRRVYLKKDPNQLIDFEFLDFPSDVVTYNYNFPHSASFNEHVKPEIDRLLEQKAKDSIKKLNYCNLSMGGTNIQKDEVVRVFLGLYRIVYKYDDKEYEIWISGDGGNWLYDYSPSDPQRMEVHAEKQYALESIPPPKTGWLTFGIWIGVIGAIFTFGISLIATIICAFIRSSKKTEYEEQRAKAKKDIEDFEAPLSYEIQRFKSQKKALRGIYENVSGDASAF